MSENATLSNMSELMKTQDNRATEHPIFVVEKKVRDYGIDPNHGESGYVWISDDDGEEADEATSEACEAGFEDGHTKNYYRERWEFVQPFFTEEAATRFANSNSYHYKYGTRVYVHSAWRNYEYQAVREHFMKGDEK